MTLSRRNKWALLIASCVTIFTATYLLLPEYRGTEVGQTEFVQLDELLDQRLEYAHKFAGLPGRHESGSSSRCVDSSNPAPLPASRSCTSWVVVTSINEPTVAVQNFGSLQGWCTVVVGDTSSPVSYDANGVDFLPLAAQKSLSYGIFPHLRNCAYTRKNLGYLYAIARGAQVIFDTDDDNILRSNSIITVPKNIPEHIAPCRGVAHHQSVNPYAAFGRPDVWPRGAPFEALHLETAIPSFAHAEDHKAAFDNFSKRVRKPLRSPCTPLVVQGLADLDPDVDAVFRLTRTSELRNVVFDSNKGPVVVLSPDVAPYNSQNTLVSYDAFWTLLLPQSVTFRVTDIWRGYISQRLLQLVGARCPLAFVGATVEQRRNAHSFQRDFRSELQMYDQTARFVRFLLAWFPSGEVCARREATGAMVQLYRALAVAGYLGESDVALAESWVYDLEQIGYHAPQLAHDLPCEASEKEALSNALRSQELISAAESEPFLRCDSYSRNG